LLEEKNVSLWFAAAKSVSQALSFHISHFSKLNIKRPLQNYTYYQQTGRSDVIYK